MEKDGKDRLTPEQIRAAFGVLTGYEPRQADYAAIALLGGTVEVAAEYIWDHWLGEPTSPTLEDVEQMVRKLATNA